MSADANSSDSSTNVGGETLTLVADAVEALGVLVGDLEQDNVRLHEYVDQRESLNEFRNSERIAAAKTELETTMRRRVDEFDRRMVRLEEQMGEVVDALRRASDELAALQDRVGEFTDRTDDLPTATLKDHVTSALLEQRLREHATELRTWVLASSGANLPPPPIVDLTDVDPPPVPAVEHSAVPVSDLIGERSDFSGDGSSPRMLRGRRKRDPS